MIRRIFTLLLTLCLLALALTGCGKQETGAGSASAAGSGEGAVSSQIDPSAGEPQKTASNFLKEKKLTVTPQGDFSYLTGTFDYTDNLNTKDAGETTVRANIIINQTTVGAPEGYRLIQATVTENPEDVQLGAITWISAFDRYTGYSFEADAAALPSGEADLPDSFALPTADGSGTLPISFSVDSVSPGNITVATVIAPVDYDGTVFQVGRSSLALSDQSNAIDFGARLYTVDELPYFGADYCYFTPSNQ